MRHPEIVKRTFEHRGAGGSGGVPLKNSFYFFCAAAGGEEEEKQGALLPTPAKGAALCKPASETSAHLFYHQFSRTAPVCTIMVLE